ncbi:MAG: hypothetical protein EAX96_12455 [Candidatus Lokiarchaeota archaeon]|nr:hypothetical protein [Candidatus Lokiarchaeota archaeon]
MTHLELSEKDIKKFGQPIVNHAVCMVPSTFKFSALKSETQNLQYKGKVWITQTYLIFKGHEIVSCGKISDISDTGDMSEIPIELKSSDYDLEVEIDKIKDIFVGHDELFGRRHLIFPKLRIATSSKIWYFILFNDNLLSSKSDVEKRAEEFKEKIGMTKRGDLKREGGVPAPKIVKPKIVEPSSQIKDQEISEIPIATVVEDKSLQPEARKISVDDLKKVAKKPVVTKSQPIEEKSKVEIEAKPVSEPTTAPETPILSNIEKLKQKAETPPKEPKKPVFAKAEPKKTVAEIIKDKQEEISSKKAFKITEVKPYEPQVKTSYSPMAQVMKPTKIEDKDDVYLNELLLDMSEEVDLDILEGELSQASADTSIHRCPHCGWMLAWNSTSCPKCKKRVDMT